MIYNSIVIQGPQKTIDAISEHIDDKIGLLEDLCGGIQENHITWKRANWGFDQIDDMYVNKHHQTPVTSAAIMVGFEANGKALKWVEMVAKRFPELELEIEVEKEESSDFNMLAKFKNGVRQANQLTLF